MKDGFIKTAAASFDVTVADCVENGKKIIYIEDEPEDLQ